MGRRLSKTKKVYGMPRYIRLKYWCRWIIYVYLFSCLQTWRRSSQVSAFKICLY